MQTQTLKFKSLRALTVISNPEIKMPEQWAAFLAKKGHSKETFSYLPEHLKLDLRVSFARKIDPNLGGCKA